MVNDEVATVVKTVGWASKYAFVMDTPLPVVGASMPE